MTFDEMFNSIFGYGEMAHPFYNEYIVKRDDKELYLIQVALAGYTKQDIKVALDGNTNILSVKATGGELGAVVKQIKRGIANRTVQRKWQLPQGFEVDSIAFENGLLSIWLDYTARQKAVKEFTF